MVPTQFDGWYFFEPALRVEKSATRQCMSQGSYRIELQTSSSVASFFRMESGSRCDRPPRFGSAAFIGALVCALLPVHARTALAAFGFPNPFTPEQCAIAMSHAERRLRAEPTDQRARRIRAEAFLCLGLQDNPAALDRAVQGFEHEVARNPDDFFAQLYLAEALRARFYLSNEALEAFRRAQAVLTNANVGQARQYLARYVDRAIEEIRSMQVQFTPLIGDKAAAILRGDATSVQIGEWLTLLATTGPSGLERAKGILDAYLANYEDLTLQTLYRAELLRGELAKPVLERLYHAAADLICSSRGDDASAAQLCDLAQTRLRQLHAERVEEPVSPEKIR